MTTMKEPSIRKGAQAYVAARHWRRTVGIPPKHTMSTVTIGKWPVYVDSGRLWSASEAFLSSGAAHDEVMATRDRRYPDLRRLVGCVAGFVSVRATFAVLVLS